MGKIVIEVPEKWIKDEIQFKVTLRLLRDGLEGTKHDGELRLFNRELYDKTINEITMAIDILKSAAKLPDTKEEEVEKSCFTCKYAIEHYNLETKKTRCELFKNWVYHEDKLEQCDKWVSYKLRELKEEVKECEEDEIIDALGNRHKIDEENEEDSQWER